MPSREGCGGEEGEEHTGFKMCARPEPLFEIASVVPLML